MLEVRIHGRNGQGSVVAASLLAGSAVEESWHALTIPAVVAGGRRRSVATGVRMDHRPVSLRTESAGTNFVIVQDESLLCAGSAFIGLKPDGAVLVNSARKPSALGIGARLHTIPATRFALEHLGRPIPNTALLAAFFALTDLLPPDALQVALAANFDGDLLEANRRIVDAVVEDLRIND